MIGMNHQRTKASFNGPLGGGSRRHGTLYPTLTHGTQPM